MKENWIIENDDFNFNMEVAIKVKQKIYEKQSKFQLIEIYETCSMGNLLLLDKIVMTTERDEFIYHEVITHIPVLSHPSPKKVLVIGGGDGGTVREVARHPYINQIDLCEIDEEVVNACKEFFPTLTNKLDDPRVNIHYRDGFELLAENQNQWDVIIVDSTDPVGFAAKLFEKQFFELCFNALTDNGVLANQTGSIFFQPDFIKQVYHTLQAVFTQQHIFIAPIPTYPSSYWGFTLASKFSEPVQTHLKARWDSFPSADLKYINKEMMLKSFVLPNYLLKIIKENA